MLGNECGPPELSTPFWAYQSLPRSSLTERIPLVILVWSGAALPFPTMPHMQEHLDFGLVRPGLTNTYQPPNLGRDLPSEAFTNLYHRGLGLHIELSIVDRVASIRHQVAGWHRVIGVDNVAHGGEPSAHSERVTRWVVGVAKKNLFRSGRPACILNPMVVKLVGQ